MTLLRHPVVITSLEEDFQKIGLLTEGPAERTVGPKGLPTGRGGVAGTGNPGKNKRKEGSPADMTMGYKVGGDNLHAQGSGREDPSMDYGTTEDVDEDEDANLAEAVRFHNEFVEEWNNLGAQGAPTFVLTDVQMESLEEIAEEVVDLPAGVIQEEDDEEEDEEEDEEDEEDEDEEEDEEEVEEQVHLALDAIESLASGTALETVGEAVSAFANLALIAENLYVFFAEKDALSEGSEHADYAATFEDMAKTSAGIVDVLKSEPDTLDGDKLRSTLKEYVEQTLAGLESYVAMNEEEDEEEEEEEEESKSEGKGMKSEEEDDDEEVEEEDDEEYEERKGKRGK